MKKLLLIILILVLVIGLAPFIDGYLFKKIYYQQIANIQTQLQRSSHGELQIEVESYELGWIKSTAQLKIKGTRESSFYLPTIKSTIYHGPFVMFQGTPHLSYATITTFIYPPDVLSDEYKKNAYLKIDSLVSLNGKNWENHYLIPAQTVQGVGTWEGLTGVAYVETEENQVVKLNSDMQFGKFSMQPGAFPIPKISIEPIKSHYEMSRQLDWKGWDVEMNVNLPLVTVEGLEGGMFSINQLIMTSKNNLHNQIFHYEHQFSAKNIKLPPGFIVNTLSEAFLNTSIDNLRFTDQVINAYRQWMMQEVIPPSIDDLSVILTPSTKVVINLGSNTDLGSVAANLILSLQSVPKTESELIDAIIVDFNVRVPHALFEKMLTLYVSDLTTKIRMNPMYAQQPLKDPLMQTQNIISQFVQQGYIQKDKNDYVIELKRIGPVIKLNNKEFPTEGWMMVSIQIQQIIEKEVMPDIPVPAPQIQQPPGQGQVPVPGAVPAQQPMPGVVPPQQPVTGTGTGEQQAASVVRLDSDPASLLNHCYWMNSSSGKNIWELTPYNKLDCFKMDSCDGGQGRSGGGCYKWAASPDADRLPW